MDRKKTTLLALAVGAVGLIAAGAVFGPGLYRQLFAKATPLGTVTRLEDVGVVGGQKAPPGRRYWAVHITPKPSPGEAKGKMEVFSESSIELGQPAFPGFGPNSERNDPMRDTYIVDDTGEKHAALQAQGKLMTQDESGPPGTVSLHFRLERLIFSLPQERQPRFLQVSDAPAVRLPGAS